MTCGDGLLCPAPRADPMAVAGPRAPDFELEAAVSGRRVRAANGRPTVLVFHGPKTTDAPKAIGKAVRAAHPKAKDVFVANIVDLRSMRGMWQKVANAGIKANYERMASKMDGRDPADYVVICPDWEGKVCRAFGVADPNRAPAVAVLGADGELRGMAAHGELAAQVIGWLD